MLKYSIDMGENKKIKVAIVGVGPVGMIMAVKLKEAGCDVVLCVRNKIKLNQIKSEGIKLEGRIETVTFFDEIYSSVNEMAKAKVDLDYLVFALKS